MSFEQGFLEGLAARVASNPNALQRFTWNVNADYASTDRGVYLMNTPQTDQPHLILWTYPVQDDPTGNTSILGVQFQINGQSDPRWVLDVIDDLFGLFHSMWADTIGGVKVTSAERRSGTNPGQDASGRVRCTQNYYFTITRPTPNRI